MRACTAAGPPPPGLLARVSAQVPVNAVASAGVNVQRPQGASARTNDVEARRRLGGPEGWDGRSGPGLAGHEHGPAVPVEQHPGSEGPGEDHADLALFGVSRAKTGGPDVR